MTCVELWGTQVRQARKRLGLSQRDVADFLGVTRAAVSHWEASRWLPTVGTVRAIYALLGVPGPTRQQIKAARTYQQMLRELKTTLHQLEETPDKKEVGDT